MSATCMCSMVSYRDVHLLKIQTIILKSRLNCYKSTIQSRTFNQHMLHTILDYSPIIAILLLISSSNPYTMMSQSHHKLAEQSRCLGPAECSCSQCKREATYFNANDEASLSRSRSQTHVAHMGDGHRCKSWACPICNPGR